MNILKELRVKNNLKQRQVAESLGITTSYYGMIELGKREPSLSLAIKISRYFNLSVEEIFNTSEDINEGRGY